MWALGDCSRPVGVGILWCFCGAYRGRGGANAGFGAGCARWSVGIGRGKRFRGGVVVAAAPMHGVGDLRKGKHMKQRRSGLLVAVGVMNILVGGAGLLFAAWCVVVGGLYAVSSDPSQSEPGRALVMMGLGVLVASGMMAGSAAGLFCGAAWGRWMGVAAGVCGVGAMLALVYGFDVGMGTLVMGAIGYCVGETVVVAWPRGRGSGGEAVGGLQGC